MMLNVRELLDELKNKGLYKERKELIRELAEQDVTDEFYSSYKDALLGDSLMTIQEYYDTQARVLDRFFPLCTDEGNLYLEIQPIEYDENTALLMEIEEE